MAGRQAHGGQQVRAAKIPKAKSKKNRALNAFAIAAKQHPEKLKIKSHRLGESEGDSRPGKRSRTQGDEDEDEGEHTREEPKKKRKAQSNEVELEEGSDSEGNEWKMGQVDSDDDSELDSDDAFAESDDEKFEGFAFSGSTENIRNKKKKKRDGDINLNENNDSEGSSSDEDSLGEDAIDLAAMLDATEVDDAEGVGQVAEENTEVSDGQQSDGSEYSDDESSGLDYDNSDSDDDPDKVLALQRLIANLPHTNPSAQSRDRQRSDNASEYATPSDFRVTPKAKLTLQDLGLPSIQDKFVKRSLKLLSAEAKSESKKNGVSGKLAVPLARREQERLDRSAAYEKTKETLDRWTDTIKHNRRAEHLIFPLPDADRMSMTANTKLQPTTSSKPFNELEAAIQNILEQSGLATTDGKTDEDKIAEFEELKANKMTLEEIKARRDQLRIARELMFREEARAKRIKKIKSKSYRRVHRKQREKEERLNQEALLEAGAVVSEDEQEAHDRRRAEERMGSKHRGSKWAKATKDTGRAAWDEDSRAAMNEMAVRDEELRKRIEGRSSLRNGVDMDESLSESEDLDTDDDEVSGEAQLLKRLGNTKDMGPSSSAGVGTRLSNMAFMLKADASRKRENDDAVEEMRKELAMENSEPEIEVLGDIGRRSFGPKSQGGAESNYGKMKNDLVNSHEYNGEYDKERPNSTLGQDRPAPKVLGNDNQQGNSAPKPKSNTSMSVSDQTPQDGAWSQVRSRKGAAESSDSRRRKQKAHASDAADELDLTNASMIAASSKPSVRHGSKKKITSAEPTLLHVLSDDSSDGETGLELPFAIRDQALITRAFAGADVVGEFETEKRQTIEDEDEKILDTTLPGWGSWTGDGLGKKYKARNKNRSMLKVEGVKEKDRKDAKLEKVIINERRVKKNVKYLASSLPHPFETKAQYERSLRLPVGPEWTTKETFQDATKPRVLLKQGIIVPMSKPLV